ncbi:MAG: HAD family phosphatase [Clostridia bacterium]|nr:HAD family phosphatase [Clostridia bacterium]
MIKNVVFDFGQVLIRFDPKYMVEQYVTDPADSALLQEVVFDRLYWDKLDQGTITDAQVIAACKERVPQRLYGAVEDIYYNWIYNIPEIDGMRELIRYIKERYGVRLLVLSNICTYFAHHSGEIPILDEFEGCVFSAVCGHTKPNVGIFEHLCGRFGIDKSETLFIDDSPKNIRGAEAYGIKGYIFDGDVERLRGYLEQELEK